MERGKNGPREPPGAGRVAALLLRCPGRLLGGGNGRSGLAAAGLLLCLRRRLCHLDGRAAGGRLEGREQGGGVCVWGGEGGGAPHVSRRGFIFLCKEEER